MRKRIGGKAMMQERPDIARDSFIWCQEQPIFAKNTFSYSYKCSYILTPLYCF